MSCFRDDIVFLLYLYQRHIYPVDKSRGMATTGLLKLLADQDDSGEGDVEGASETLLMMVVLLLMMWWMRRIL